MLIRTARGFWAVLRPRLGRALTRCFYGFFRRPLIAMQYRFALGEPLLAVGAIAEIVVERPAGGVMQDRGIGRRRVVVHQMVRTEERRVGKECVSKGRSRGGQSQ